MPCSLPKRARIAAALVMVCASAALAVPTIAVIPSAAGTALDLDGDGASTSHVVKVADLVIETLAQHGLTLSVTSGSLTKTGGSAIQFQVTTTAAGAAAPTAGAFTTPSGSTYTYVTAAAGSEARDLFVLYTPATLQDPGTYSATIELTVMDNP